MINSKLKENKIDFKSITTLNILKTSLHSTRSIIDEYISLIKKNKTDIIIKTDDIFDFSILKENFIKSLFFPKSIFFV